MANNWCRLHGRIINNPKIGSLTDAEFRLYISLICLATNANELSENNDGNTKQTLEEVSWSLRINNVTLHETLQKLIVTELVAFSDEKTIKVLNWDIHNKKSDSSKSRVKKCRENKKLKNVTLHETLLKQKGNGLELEKSKRLRTTNVVLDIVHFADFWSIYPKKANRKAAEKVWKTKKLDNLYQRIANDIKLRTEKHRTWLEGFVPYAATYLNGERWEDDIEEVKAGGKNHANTTDTRKQELERIKQSKQEHNAEVFRRKREREEAERARG